MKTEKTQKLTTEMNDNLSNAANLAQDQVVEVLYQKMGDRWFAFSLIDEEVFVGSISQAEIDALEARDVDGAIEARRAIGAPITGNS